jgi:hypothetical protein
MHKHVHSSISHHAGDESFTDGTDGARGQWNEAGDRHGDWMQSSLIQVPQSDETVSGTAGDDRFVFHSLSQEGDVISDFDVGADHLAIHDPSIAPGDLASHLSLATGPDGTDVVVDAGTAGAHTLVTLQGVDASDLSAVLQSPHLPPSVIHLTQSAEDVSGTAGADRFVFHSLALHDEVIGNFTVGQDRLNFVGHHFDTARLSLVADATDPTSTDVIVDAGKAGEHTLATLQGVQTTDLSSLLHKAGASTPAGTVAPGTMDTAGSNEATGSTVDGQPADTNAGTDAPATTDTANGVTGTDAVGSGTATSGSSTPADATQAAPETSTTAPAAGDTQAGSIGMPATSTSTTDFAGTTEPVKTADLSDGHGHDVFVFTDFGAPPLTIQDFHSGEDIIDIAPVLKATGYTGQDPVADGLLNVVADGDNSSVMLGDVKLATLEHLQPSQVLPSDFWL